MVSTPLKMTCVVPTTSKVNTEVNPGLIDATYTTNQGNKQDVHTIKQELLDIDTIIKQELMSELESDTHDKQVNFENHARVKQELIDEGFVTSVNQEHFNEEENSILEQNNVERQESVKQKSVDVAQTLLCESALKQEPIDKILQHEGMRFQCTKCDKAFSTKASLKRHLSIIHEGVRYKCNNCDKFFTQKEHLKVHSLKHEGVMFQCPRCDKSFTLKGSLKRHLFQHEGVRFQCPRCDKSFNCKGSLTRHLLEHEGVRYECNKCIKSFTDKYYLKRHLLKHEGVRFQCNDCDKDFNFKENLKMHLLIHEGVRFHCAKCSRVFTSKNGLKGHLLQHEGVRFQCPKCDKSFTFKGILKRHLLRHEGVRFQCPRCDKSFPYKRNLRRHLLQHEGKSEVESYTHDKQDNGETRIEVKLEPIDEAVAQNLLGESAVKQEPNDEYSSAYKRHILQHEGKSEIESYTHDKKDNGETHIEVKLEPIDAAVEQNLLGESAVKQEPNDEYSSAYKRHILQHEGEAEIESYTHDKKDNGETRIEVKLEPIDAAVEQNLLDESAVKQEPNDEYSSAYKRHILQHVRFQCPRCDKSFAFKASLKRHLLRHEGVRFQCPRCDKSFSFKRNLRRHLLRHEGVRTVRYQCKRCEKDFSSKGNLKVHLLVHEGVKFQCALCDKDFTRKENLKRHLLQHEGKSEIESYTHDKKDNGETRIEVKLEPIDVAVAQNLLGESAVKQEPNDEYSSAYNL